MVLKASHLQLIEQLAKNNIDKCHRALETDVVQEIEDVSQFLKLRKSHLEDILKITRKCQSAIEAKGTSQIVIKGTAKPFRS